MSWDRDWICQIHCSFCGSMCKGYMGTCCVGSEICKKCQEGVALCRKMARGETGGTTSRGNLRPRRQILVSLSRWRFQIGPGHPHRHPAHLDWGVRLATMQALRGEEVRTVMMRRRVDIVLRRRGAAREKAKASQLQNVSFAGSALVIMKVR